MMCRWNSSSVRWLSPKVREIVAQFGGSFTAREVYEQLRHHYSRCPTYMEFTHGICKFKFIKREGVEGNRIYYSYKAE